MTRRSLKDFIGVIWKILTLPFWLPIKLNKMFANTDTRAFALDVVQTIATFAAAIGLFITYLNASLDRQLAQERLVTDRFAKAVEQIGNDKEEVMIGGIYSLERIAKDSPEDQWTIMEVLTAFVRNNSPIPPEIQELEDGSQEKLKKALQELSVNISTQAALTVIGRRNPEQDYTLDKVPKENTKRLDLRNSYLTDADFGDAYLRDGYLRNAYLYDANFRNANLHGVDFFDADLRYADLFTVDLEDAFLTNANLEDANLTNANLKDANLKDANFSNEQIKLACNWKKAIYTEAEFNLDREKWIIKPEHREANQERIEEIRQDKASEPKISLDCDKWNYM